jgi:hypothetical protein
MSTRTVTAPPQLPDTSVLPSVSGKQPPIGAVAGAAGDGCCHWYVSTTQTLCGLVHAPVAGLHQQPPCPNGCEPCSFCTGRYAEEYQ